jgi:hypothetical protein
MSSQGQTVQVGPQLARAKPDEAGDILSPTISDKSRAGRRSRGPERPCSIAVRSPALHQTILRHSRRLSGRIDSTGATRWQAYRSGERSTAVKETAPVVRLPCCATRMIPSRFDATSVLWCRAMQAMRLVEHPELPIAPPGIERSSSCAMSFNHFKSSRSAFASRSP